MKFWEDLLYVCNIDYLKREHMIRFNLEKIGRAKLFDIFGKFIRIVCCECLEWCTAFENALRAQCAKILSVKEISFPVTRRVWFRFNSLTHVIQFWSLSRIVLLYNLKHYILILYHILMRIEWSGCIIRKLRESKLIWILLRARGFSTKIHSIFLSCIVSIRVIFHSNDQCLLDQNESYIRDVLSKLKIIRWLEHGFLQRR